MPASHAQVPTSRAARYLAQLCSHGRLMSRLTRHRAPVHSRGQEQDHEVGHGSDGAPPAATATSSGTEGIIDFGWGRCTLRATGEALTLRAEASPPGCSASAAVTSSPSPGPRPVSKPLRAGSRRSRAAPRR